MSANRWTLRELESGAVRRDLLFVGICSGRRIQLYDFADDRTNVISITFKSIDQSGSLYAHYLTRHQLTVERRRSHPARCGLCRGTGHDRRTCPARKAGDERSEGDG